MQSRRDQVQAQTYVLGRLSAALVSAEPDGPESPHRRLVVGTLIGLLVATLAVAGFAIFGLLRPGGATSWKAPGVLVLEKETGTRYVYVDGALRPLLNYTSARLLFGKAPRTVSVSQRSLRDVPHGQPIGIVGAPDALPAPGTVAKQVWTVCALSRRDQAGVLFTGTTLTISTSSQSPPGEPLARDRAVLVAAGGDSYLVWQGRRFRLGAEWLARVLGYDRDAVAVEAAWLETLPVGPDLAPIPVPGRGGRGPLIDGRPTRVGQLFLLRTPGASERRYLLRREGLVELGPLAYAVAAGDPGTSRAYPGASVVPTELTPGALSRTPVVAQPALPADLPETPPAVADLPAGRTWCVEQELADGAVRVTAQRIAPPAPVQDAPGIVRTERSANVVGVSAGLGGLVVAGRPGQTAGPAMFLVTDAGVKFPVAADAARRLGYQPEQAWPVPRRLLDMLPTGPVITTASGGG